MKKEDIKPGVIAYVNTSGDFMMCRCPCINEYVTIVKLTKAGLVQVMYDHKLYSIRPSNLDYVQYTKENYEKSKIK